MADAQEGFCTSCAEKPQEAGEEPATLCGHPAHVKGTRFCVPCAANLGVCRLCGQSFRSARKEGPD